MQRYFFDIDYAGLRTEDHHGIILADTDAAKHELLTALVEMASAAFGGAESGVIFGAVREQVGAVIFEAQIELRSKSVS